MRKPFTHGPLIGHSNNATIPDATVRAVRAASTIERLTIRQIHRRFPHLAEMWIRRVLAGELRGKVR